ncbi:sarcosine oxidase subunit alpha [Methylohalomonas lacus]|uniref:Sarcosine oxidase subunit alpha n=1 Tax=Methylohalomonas lacus TaxID=398773 RepID=A0AAE3HHK6_9GAMM|nr:2Fe-2S iron-sulfur cluster-binding protein [Methylohalomonas lacus]MCS3902030.1 sarcosine oxidase subunit alpha [Methylohalomonas lacus]
MSDSTRLPAPAGSLIDRSATRTFTFEGRQYTGYAGDTIASALLANGVNVLSRSFKYHRPRGPLVFNGQDTNCFLQVGSTPNVRADRAPLTEGLNATPQNVFGSLRFDFGSAVGLLAPFLPVGFYYKAFYKPRGAWRFWEPVIRRMAGLGKLDHDARPAYRDKAYRFADTVVIGAGPAGLAAALEASSHGASVMLVEAGPRLGGSLNYARFMVERDRVVTARDELVAAVEADPNIEVLTDAACTGWFDDNWLAVMLEERLLKVRAKSVVIASGSIEQPMVFRNNDLPGVMLGSAAQRLMREYAIQPGRRAVVATANSDGYGVALDLLDHGVEVAAVVDLRAVPPDCELSRAVAERGVRIITGHTPYEALPAGGKRGIRGVVIDALGHGSGLVAGQPQTIDCDLLCTSIGYTPAGQLVCHSGGALAYDEKLAMLTIEQLPGDTAAAAGSVNTVFNLYAVFEDGRHAGWSAARAAGLAVGAEPGREHESDAGTQNHPWPIFPHPKGKDFIDFDEDLQVKDILHAIEDGYDDLDLVKRYSTVVMGPSQGRYSALNTLRVATRATGRELHGARVTTQRPPFEPETINNLAGRAFQPVKYTPMHQRHVDAGAELISAGAWLRPAYYGDRDQVAAAIEREARAIREGVGLIDVSTLGKIEIRGPDAAEFLNRVYTFAYVKQPIGKTRYLLMTEASGAITDDGVACRLAEDHFYVTATTGGVDAVYRNMMRLNAEWCLQIDITNVTGAWAAVNLAGPESRKVLEKLTDDIDCSSEGFPYLFYREGHVAGVPARLARVGFVGELGYEIHVPAGYGEHLWDAILAAGADHGIRPVGVEAQRLLRLEKGHLIVGQDTDGLTTPHEAGMAWAVAGKKPFFVGKRAVEVLARGPLTRQLAGFELPAGSPVPQECNIVVRGEEITGRVTSAAASPTLNKVIGLAYVAPDQSEPGTTIQIKLSDGRLLPAKIVTAPFYDPDSERQAL